MFSRPQSISDRVAVALLILVYLAICCVSADYSAQIFQSYRLTSDPASFFRAGLTIAMFAPVLLLFTFARFSFGYFIGFYFFSMIAGYLWISFFSNYAYDRRTASWSAVASVVAFLLPALFMTSPIKQVGAMSLRTFDRLLDLIFVLCLITIACGAIYNFKLLSPAAVSNARTDPFPGILNYLIPATSSSLLPFLFAASLARRNLWRAGAVLLLLLFYYPVSLSKVAFFAPAWLVLMALLARAFGARLAVILSLLIPSSIGTLLIFLFHWEVPPAGAVFTYFQMVNFRMIAIPSIAMDVYNDFFANHAHTWFCQIRLLKSLVQCPYQVPLSIVMFNNYPFGGNFNASLFATEGIASVGVWLAPIPVFVGGLVIALGNRLSAGLPPSFVLVSGAILPQILLNVPLSTVLLTHGAGLLFLLWYVTPRGIFERNGIFRQECPDALEKRGRWSLGQPACLP
jgi:hypothetical protein